MRYLAIIPARAGSKGIKGKNMSRLGGKPLVQHAIQQAEGCPEISKILVSSDCPDVLSLTKDMGLETGYQRPPSLSSDTTPMIDTVLHCIDYLEEEGDSYDAVILLQPTSPLRTSWDIQKAIQKFEDSKSDALASVHEMTEHPYECVEYDGRTWSPLLRHEGTATRRQEYTGNYYFINGAIYIAKISFLIENRQFIDFKDPSFYIMNQNNGIDIDLPHDLELADFLYRNPNTSRGS